MHTYNKKLNGEIHECEVCGNTPTHIDLNTGKRIGSVMQHHVGGKTYDDRAIWVCNDCHQKIHNPTAFGLPGSWSYDNNYLLRRSNTMIKAKKEKKCLHTKTIGWPPKCLYCKQPVNAMAHGTKKKAQVAESSKKIKMGYEQQKGEVSSPNKIGYEKQDPRIIEAEKMKRKYTSLTVAIKRAAYEPEKYAALKKEQAELKAKMKALQQSFEE